MRGFSAGDFAEFNGLLASVVERGLGLESAVDLLVDQARSRKVRDALGRVAASLRDGGSLPQALESAPDLFPEEYRALVRAGVESRRLAEVLRTSENYHSLRAKMAGHVKRMGIYLAAGTAMCCLCLSFLVALGPRMAGIYLQLGMRDLPVSTQLVLDAAVNFWTIALGAVVVAVLVMIAYRIARRLRISALMIYWIPLWGRLQKSRDLALLCATLALKLRSGASLPDGMRAAAEALPNRHGRAAVDAVRRRVEEGEALSTALFYRRFFPRTLAWAVSLGETRGDLPDVFDLFGRLYWTDVERSFGMAYVALTPLGILALGNVAFFTVMSLFQPIFQVQAYLSGP